MLIQAGRIQFATKDDIIDYVSKGLFPPRKRDFNNLMMSVTSGGKVTERYDQEMSDSLMPVHITAELTQEEREMINTVLIKVYKNRVRNRNIFIIGSLAFLALISVLTIIVLIKRKETLPDLHYETFDMGDFTLTRF